MVNSLQLSWLAGLVEGEGSITLRRGKEPCVELVMVDEDVVRRAQAVAGVGVVYGGRVLPSGKRAWRWAVRKVEHAAGIIMTLYPLLGERRQARAREVLDAWKRAPLPRRRRTHCLHGHPLSGDNLLREGNHRRCRECATTRMQGYRARLKAAATEAA